jgi:tetratricopeptide (TPR) repeat protein
MVDATEAVSLGRQARNDGNFTMAREHYAEAAKTYRDQKDLLAYAHTIRHIADIFRQERNLTEAKPLYEESLEAIPQQPRYKTSRPCEYSQALRSPQRRTRQS